MYKARNFCDSNNKNLGVCEYDIYIFNQTKSMNNPQLYKCANILQRRSTQNIIYEFSNILQWRLDGKDTLLDVGCGSGDVLMDFIYPIVPKDFQKIVGLDISSEMIQYCKKTYSQIENVDFKILDIGTESLPKEFISEFNHVTSFFCLHWVQNQRQAIKNIYQMLQTNGDCVLVFVASAPMFDIYKCLSMNPKWASYMKDLNSHISPLHSVKDPHMEFCQLLEEAGFMDYSVELRDQVFVYEGFDIMKKNIRVINPFIDRMPITMHSEFLDEIIKRLIGINVCDSINEGHRFLFASQLIIAYARK